MNEAERSFRRFHPLTKIAFPLSVALLVFQSPAKQQFLAALLFFLATNAYLWHKRSKWALASLRLLSLSLMWLALIHSLRFSPPYFLPSAITTIAPIATRFAIVLAAVGCLTATIEREELYALGIRLGVPTIALFLVLKSLFLLPDFQKRANEVLVACYSRGEHLGTVSGRAKAIVRSVPALLGAVLSEQGEAALALSTKGLFEAGPRTTLTELAIGWRDLAALSLFACLAVVAAIT